MYLDKLDGRIEADSFDRKEAEWRRDEDAALRAIQAHQNVDQSYIEDGIQLLVRPMRSFFNRTLPKSGG